MVAPRTSDVNALHDVIPDKSDTRDEESHGAPFRCDGKPAIDRRGRGGLRVTVIVAPATAARHRVSARPSPRRRVVVRMAGTTAPGSAYSRSGGHHGCNPHRRSLVSFLRRTGDAERPRRAPAASGRAPARTGERRRGNRRLAPTTTTTTARDSAAPGSSTWARSVRTDRSRRITLRRAACGSRTHDLRITSASLWPTELRRRSAPGRVHPGAKPKSIGRRASGSTTRVRSAR